MNKKSYFQLTFGIGALVLIDQLLKWLTSVYLQTPLFLTSWLSFRYEKNVGVAWSMPIPYALLVVINLILVIAIPILISKKIDLTLPLAKLLTILLLGGALGNLLDRIFRGFVVDYLAVGWWPVFNLADACLTTSIFLIFVFYDKIKRKI